jgi:predicted metal-dependent RNase
MDITSDAFPSPDGGIKVSTEISLSVTEVQSVGAIIEFLRDLSSDPSQAYVIMSAQRRGTMQDAADLLEKVFRVKKMEAMGRIDPLMLIKGSKA